MAGGLVDLVRMDVAKLVESMEQRHPDLFHDVTKAEWDAAVAELDTSIPDLVLTEPERLSVEVMRLAALPASRGGGDGHMVAFPPLGAETPLFALATYVFADGIYVTAGTPPHEDLVGARITAVAGRPIAEVMALLDPLIPRDNAWTPEMHLPSYLIQPEILVGLGILDDVGPAEFTFELPEGSERTEAITLVPSRTLEPYRIFTTFRLPIRAGEPWTAHIDDRFWWSELHDGTTLFAQLNEADSIPTDSQDAFLRAAAKDRVRRVVLDLRHNPGGTTSEIASVFRDSTIDRHGRLFVITSTNTFSAASELAARLDTTTDAIFVGEPTGGAPNFFSPGDWVTLRELPNPISVLVPGTFFESVPGDQRDSIEPDIRVPLTAGDYFDDRDAALAAILREDATRN